MKSGARITLKGKSLKGKNRIGQHGTEWVVERVTPSMILVSSINKTFKNSDGSRTTDIRWVHIPTDVDFEIIKGAL